MIDKPYELWYFMYVIVSIKLVYYLYIQMYRNHKASVLDSVA